MTAISQEGILGVGAALHGFTCADGADGEAQRPTAWQRAWLNPRAPPTQNAGAPRERGGGRQRRDYRNAE
jgi:hypothetical protein